MTRDTPFRRPRRGVPDNRSAAIVLFLCALAFPASCSLPDETAAIVNGQSIPTTDLEDAYEDFLSQFGEVAPPGAKEAKRARRVLLERLVDQELMRQEVERLSLEPSAEDVSALMQRVQGDLRDKEFGAVLTEAGFEKEKWRKKIVRDLSLERLQEQQVYRHVDVTAEEVESYLRRHRDKYEQPEQVRASQILVRTREEAVEARNRIRKGGDFAEVAREISQSPDAETGGDLGYFSRGQMPQEFDAVVFSLTKGKISPVVETTYGYHLFLVTDRREARGMGDDEIHAEARHALLLKKREESFRQWLEDLRKNAEVRYNDNVISP